MGSCLYLDNENVSHLLFQRVLQEVMTVLLVVALKEASTKFDSRIPSAPFTVTL